MRVLIQRTYEFDPETQPEIREAIEVFAANGFEVYGIEAVAAPRREEARDIVQRIMESARIRPPAVGRMLGVHEMTVRSWLRGSNAASEGNLVRLRDLERSLAGRSPQEIAALAEGAALANGMRIRRSPVRLSESDQQEIFALARDGAKVSELAIAYRASDYIIRRLLDKDATTGV
jgi:hypothetical protein